MKVTHGRSDMTMTEQTLNGVDVDTGLQQVGREGVAQGMDAARVGDSRRLTGGVIHPLGGTGIDGASPARLANSQRLGRVARQYRRRESSRRGEQGIAVLAAPCPGGP